MLQRDSIWEVFTGANDFESFQKNILEPIYLKPQVPEDVKSEIAIIEKLLLHSYFEFQFIDLALSQAVFTLEKSLRIRYREINNESSKKIKLGPLIDWFFDNEYFETRNKDVLHQLRNIRNGKVHNETKSLGGIAFLQKVYTVFYLINDIYEDPQLRKVRKQEIIKCQSFLNEFLKEGGIISVNGKRIIIFKADIIFLNNKLNTQRLTLVVWPIFDPKPNCQNKHFKPSSFEIEISDWEIGKYKFTGNSIADNSKITITKITDEVNTGKFLKWKDEFYALSDFALILFLTTELDDNFYSILRKFHQLR